MEARAGRTVRFLLAWCLALLSLPSAAAADGLEEPPCPRSGDTVIVLTHRHMLWLCTDGAPSARFTVSLGHRGVGKRRRGDGRTPLGTYPLGAPRPSALYRTFIPIAYPTPAQAALGFSGDSVGIHGPPRGMDELLYPVTQIDWTLGCIATGSDAAVDAIADFVRARRPSLVIR